MVPPWSSGAGQLAPAAKWWNASAYAGPFPATQAAQKVAARYFAAQWGLMPTLPQAILAVYMPRIRITFTGAAYTNLTASWQVRLPLCLPACLAVAVLQLDVAPPALIYAALSMQRPCPCALGMSIWADSGPPAAYTCPLPSCCCRPLPCHSPAAGNWDAQRRAAAGGAGLGGEEGSTQHWRNQLR